MNSRFERKRLFAPLLLLALSWNLPGRDAIAGCERFFGDCRYYLCKQEEKGCDRDGYYLRFGHRFCEKYEKRAPHFTPAGQEWLARVRFCLQKKLESDGERNSCDRVEDFAFETHTQCYVETGFCDLGMHDRIELIRVALGAQGYLRRAAATFLKIQRTCRQAAR